MKEAIQKAIEGGWVNNQAILYHTKGIDALVYSDPLFWKALGKAMGWKELCEDGKCAWCGQHWKDHWVRFTLHLAEGKDAESFFKELLK